MLLCLKIAFVADAMRVVALVPNSTQALITNREGVSALDRLDTAGCALVYRRSDEDVHVVKHDGECVEAEFALVTVAEESGDEQLGVRRRWKWLRR